MEKYYDYNDKIDWRKVVSNLNDHLNTDRTKNVGPLVSNSMFLGIINAIELNEVPFPKEYSYLLDKNQLNEKTLKEEAALWDLITSKPETTKQIIDKEIALICLNWAQSKLDQKVSSFDNSLLTYVSHQIVGRNKSTAKITLELQLRERASNKKSLRKGSYLMLKSVNEVMDIPMFRVRDIKDNCITLTVCVRRISSDEGLIMFHRLLNFENLVVSGFENQPDFIPQSMLRSIERIQSGALNHFITPELNFKTDIEATKNAMEKLLPTIRYKAKLNEHQSRVLYSICTSTHGNSPYILKGPPGTGKTRLIAKTVKQLLEMNSNIRVLMTAPSNMAADMLAEKIMDEFDEFGDGVLNSGNVLRLRSINNDYFGRDKKFDPIVRLDYEMESFSIPETEEFRKLRVVICTLGCATHIINRNIPSGFFTHIFLDEAGQASECDIWIPLGGLATRDTSVILCGDHKQLGPVITLNLSTWITKKFDSPLIRYMQMEAYQTDLRLFCQLERSYRCHKMILSVASNLFYENQLLSAIVERHEPFEYWTELPKKEFPLMFVSVYGQESCERGGFSYANEEEIKVVMHYIQKLSQVIETSEIGVISPYKYQTRLICQELKNSSIPDTKKITVDSVERFQGSERKAIIMTGIRTSSTSLGFMADDLRVNTSITRAKNLLIVIGNRRALSKHESWRLFIDYCEQNNALIEWGANLVDFDASVLDGFAKLSINEW